MDRHDEWCGPSPHSLCVDVRWGRASRVTCTYGAIEAIPEGSVGCRVLPGPCWCRAGKEQGVASAVSSP